MGGERRSSEYDAGDSRNEVDEGDHDEDDLKLLYLKVWFFVDVVNDGNLVVWPLAIL